MSDSLFDRIEDGYAHNRPFPFPNCAERASPWPRWAVHDQDLRRMLFERNNLKREIEQLRAEKETLREAIKRAPCHQNRIPCRWPCDNDPSDFGPCWKRAAIGGTEQ